MQDIPAESAIFTIPRHAIISTETSALPQKLPDLFESQGDEDHEQGLDSWSGLILVMMYEFLLGDQSRWKPYLDVLPEEFDTPMFWSNAELSELQASAVVGKIGKDSAEEMFRSRLLPAIRENPNVFTSSGQWSDNELLQLAHRMGSTIMAYAFDLEGEEAGDETGEDGWIEDREGKSLMGMVAMADILNADAEFNVWDSGTPTIVVCHRSWTNLSRHTSVMGTMLSSSQHYATFRPVKKYSTTTDPIPTLSFFAGMAT